MRGWLGLSSLKKVCIVLAALILCCHLVPLAGTAPSRTRFSARSRRKRKTKWKAIKRTSRTCRRCTTKRGDKHYDQAGGIDGSYLLRPTTKEAPYLTRAEMDHSITKARGNVTTQLLSDKSARDRARARGPFYCKCQCISVLLPLVTMLTCSMMCLTVKSGACWARPKTHRSALHLGSHQLHSEAANMPSSWAHNEPRNTTSKLDSEVMLWHTHGMTPRPPPTHHQTAVGEAHEHFLACSATTRDEFEGIAHSYSCPCRSDH